MKKRKILYLICVLALSIFISTGCELLAPSAGEKTEPGINGSSKVESDRDNNENNDLDTEDLEDKNKSGEDKDPKDEEKSKEKKSEKIDKEIKDESKKNKPNSNSSRLGFNDNETENLKKAIKEYSVTLIEDDNQEHSDVNLDKIEAIAIFEDDSSYGWICKYDDNKIGVAQVPHETIYEDGEEYHPVQIVKIWGEKHIYEGGASGIKDNDPELYKAACKEITKTFHFDDGLQIKLLFD